MPLPSALDLPVPRNVTALLQHLQRLVGIEGHRQWCGGTIAVDKLPAFVRKMQQRYPIRRTTRERSYDRRRGRAVVHMIVYPLDHAPCELLRTSADTASPPVDILPPTQPHDIARDSAAGTVAWWLVSSPGAGGLLDPLMPDARVSRDAMSATSHITFRDYVLLYASKRELRRVGTNPRTGQPLVISRDASAWTWKIRTEVVKQIRSELDDYCRRVGNSPRNDVGHYLSRLLGLLEAQRSRPLFSGVRNQVFDLHRHALDIPAVNRLLHAEHANATEGRATCAYDTTRFPRRHAHLPKMRRMQVWGDAPLRIRYLLPAHESEREGT